MSDRPILFNPPMVRALLDGRKTQTRRAIKPGRNSLFDGSWADSYVLDPGNADWRARDVRCAVGDRLWVRERWRVSRAQNLIAPRDLPQDISIEYMTNGDETACVRLNGRPRAAIHMPRWASRLTLTVTDVRVERLQDISGADVRAEGVEYDTDGWRDYLMPSTQCCLTARDSYVTLWDSINGPGAWEANPWIMAMSFDVHRCNIDQMEGGA